MARITIEDCLKRVSNRFVVVQMANLRLKQIIKGSKLLVNAPDNKMVVVSLREIAAGKVKLDERSRRRLNEEEGKPQDAEVR
jgi:DNA-directed RNA polymerase subunit omega